MIPVYTYPKNPNGMKRCVHVQQCGHRFDPKDGPRHVNCQSCWFTYFLTMPTQRLVAYGESLNNDTMKAAVKDELGKKGFKFFVLFADIMESVREAKQAQQRTCETCGADMDPEDENCSACVSASQHANGEVTAEVVSQ